ncbi:MAG: sialate O-acetylesterase [Bacteroidia bacterium]|nr:sialate O-acetylesterase [Bacteroidia bacterium]
MKIPVWGLAGKDEKITVSIGNNIAQTTADINGRWMVKLKPMKAGGPFNLKVSGENVLEFSNVLVGDVWLCSGQSNMEFEVRRSVNSEKEIANSDYHGIRLFSVDQVSNADSTRNDVNGEWLECNSNTIDDFSAVAYFFGRDLQKEINVPIGLIDNAWGGTRIEAWTSREALKRLDCGRKELEAYASESQQKDTFTIKINKDKIRDLKETRTKGNTNDSKPKKQKSALKNSHSVSSLFNCMIYPLIPYGIKGVIWYQGEANSKSKQNAIDYGQLLPNMIKNWRKDWGQGDFPFIFVQLPNFQSNGFWPLVRESMLQTYLSEKKTGMAVAIDLGEKDNGHPSNKQDVGHRLLLQALDIAYEQKDIVSQGPIFKSMKIKNGEAILSFEHIGSGLTTNKKELKGFTIAGSDKQFYEAEANIIRDKVIIHNKNVKDPVAVRYAWENNPEYSLYNKEELPASPFRTDNWN